MISMKNNDYGYEKSLKKSVLTVFVFCKQIIIIIIIIIIRRPLFRGCHQAARMRCLPVIYSALVSQL